MKISAGKQRSYTVHELAKLSNVSVRTLHYYDQIGLLPPARVEQNGYRSYEEPQLLKLQQILFFRELDFPLADIRRIMSDPNFDMRQALRDQRKLILLSQTRLNTIIKTIDKTLQKINHRKNMDDKDLYGGLSKEQIEEYAAEAKERWGNTEAYKQSRERVKKMGPDGMKKVAAETDKLTSEIAASMHLDPGHEIVQALISRHYEGLRAFYEPTLEMYRGLGEMYVADPRFTAHYESYAPGLALFMRDTMVIFANERKKN